MRDVAQAFVPGHVTGFFTVDLAEDPTEAGSRGAGLALSEGVTVTVRPSEDRELRLNGEAVSVAAVHNVLDALRAGGQVRAVTDLPVGAGFGVSGAMALGTALAANAVFERGLSAYELATIAHGAEVQADTGLGDVVAQRHGGVPIRLEPGSPQVNKMDAVPERSRVEYVTDGEVPTAEVIGGDTDLITQAGTQSLSDLVRDPTLSTFVETSRRFARETNLLTEWVHDVVRDVSAAGGEATMGMLGQTVVALGTGLSDAGYDPSVCQVDPTGATLLAPPTDPTLPE
ncbi:sugar kinase [Halobacteriales archaeon QH_10_67_22]|nr:MAG: sugar kinase [Halobacteriales archaeon QH_10_67_22]